MTIPHYLALPQGRIAYDAIGEGPLVLLVPGMGDLRSTFRFLVPGLAAAGFRVVAADLRGHGDSDCSFDSYGDVQTAGDLAALIEALGGRAVVVGNSMSAGSAAYLAADRPDLVAGLVLMGPFVRDPGMTTAQRLLLRAAMAPVWAPFTWKAYVPKLYAGRRPADFDDHLGRIFAALRRPGYAAAFSATTRTGHAPVAARLGEVRVPSLVVMGELDPDFPDPAAEAAWVAGQLHGQVLMAPGAGHYPQSQRPDIVLPAIVELAARAHADA